MARLLIFPTLYEFCTEQQTFLHSFIKCRAKSHVLHYLCCVIGCVSEGEGHRGQKDKAVSLKMYTQSTPIHGVLRLCAFGSAVPVACVAFAHPLCWGGSPLPKQ